MAKWLNERLSEDRPALIGIKDEMVTAGLSEPTFESNVVCRAIFQQAPEFALKERRFGDKIRKKVRRWCGNGVLISLTVSKMAIISPMVRQSGCSWLSRDQVRTNLGPSVVKNKRLPREVDVSRR